MLKSCSLNQGVRNMHEHTYRHTIPFHTIPYYSIPYHIYNHTHIQVTVQNKTEVPCSHWKCQHITLSDFQDVQTSLPELSMTQGLRHAASVPSLDRELRSRSDRKTFRFCEVRVASDASRWFHFSKHLVSWMLK